jgi:hypothetical protein
LWGYLEYVIARRLKSLQEAALAVKRKKTDIAELKLRIREDLRFRIEKAAKAHDTSLNLEMCARLEQSFLQAENAMLLESLLAGGPSLWVLRAISVILRQVGEDWVADTARVQKVSNAIDKFMLVVGGVLPLTEDSFPDLKVNGSSDQLAYTALLSERFLLQFRGELTAENPE